MIGAAMAPRAVLVLAALGVGAFAVAGLPARAAPAAGATAARVLIVSYPRLQWAGVDAQHPPALEGLFARGAVASLSIRTAPAVTTLAGGYVTIGAGNRAAIDEGVAGGAADEPGGGVVVPPDELAAARRDADRQLYGAEPGALGAALGRAGLRTAVIGGPEAALAMMDSAGAVASGTVTKPVGAAVVTAFDQVWPTAAVTLVELDDPTTADPTLAALLARVDPARDLVMVAAPVAPRDGAELTAFAVAGPGIGPGLARSATTRRDGYVTLPDIAVTALDALGVDRPDSMNGTRITSGGGTPYGAATAGQLADTNTIAVFRDRSVGPVTVIFVALQIATYALAIVALVQRRPGLGGAMAMLGLVIVAVPVVAFLAGLIRYDRLGLAWYTLAVFAGAAVVAVAARATGRWHPLAPLLVLLGLSWVVLVVDVVTGGRLQINTTFGYSPIVAGRFQGIGNLAFAVLVGSAIVVATGLWGEARRAEPAAAGIDRWWVAAVAIMVVSVVVDGWPTFGADVGGVLASGPAFALVAVTLAGWRLSGRRVAVIVAGTVGLVAVFAVVDLLRPADQRTHLGRFVADVFNGDAGIVVRRKVESNWHILTSSVWALIVPVLVVVFAVVVTRRRGLLADVQAQQPGLRAGLIGALVAAVLGFAVNDSGIAIPAMMIAMVVPWMLAVARRATAPVPVASRGAP